MIEVYLSANEPKILRGEYSRDTKILDAEYKPASLDDYIKVCENIHVEGHHHHEILLQKYDHLNFLFEGTLKYFNMEQCQLVSN
jgi:hypothetical protein